MTQPQHLSPWCCPRCGADCSGTANETKDLETTTGYFLNCACGCEFVHWVSCTYEEYCLEVDGQEYDYPQEPNPGDLLAGSCLADVLREFVADVDAVGVEHAANEWPDLMATYHKARAILAARKGKQP